MERSAASKRLIVALSLGVACLMAIPPYAEAHERVRVGDFEFILGWAEEPPVAGVLNGLDLGVMRGPEGGSLTPVEGAEANLTASILFGTANYTRPLDPQFGRPGWYTFPILPTRPGAYRVEDTGNLNGTAIDIGVELEEVSPAGDFSFPTVQPTPDQLAQADQEAARRIGEAQAAVGQAQALAVAGLVLGAIALLVSVAALLRRRA